MHTTQTSGSRRLISQSAIENVFGIDLLNEATEQNAQPIQNTMSVSKALKPSKQTNKKVPNYFSGIRVKKLRVKLGLTQVAFAKKVGVSAGTVCKWERQGRYKLNLRQETLMALQNQIGSAVK